MDTLKKEVNISGQIKSIFREVVDSALIKFNVNGYEYYVFSDTLGFFNIRFSIADNSNSVHLFFTHYDYRPFDTVLFFDRKNNELNNMVFQLIPKYKILLKGRVSVGNTLLEDVNVIVKHRDEISKLVTLGCYIDDEKYWNCLYLGMFKTEITAENPEDTIYLEFSKFGFKTKYYKIIFSEYSGDIIRFKLKYADSVPDLPYNNLNFKILYPFTDEMGWFLSLGYSRQIKFGNFDRISVGGDVVMSSFKFSDKHPTLPDFGEALFDTTYVTGFIGPSVYFYLTKPHLRWFSSYIGVLASISMDKGEFVPQPYIGTRIFLDLRKSLSFELRYFSYHKDIVRYNFDYLGDPEPYSETLIKNKLVFNLGIQINF